MGKVKKSTTSIKAKKSSKKSPTASVKKPLKKPGKSPSSKETTVPKKILAFSKSKKNLTAEGWKRLMMGAKKE